MKQCGIQSSEADLSQFTIRDDIIKFSHDLINSARNKVAKKKSFFNKGRTNISGDFKAPKLPKNNLRHPNFFIWPGLNQQEKLDGILNSSNQNESETEKLDRFTYTTNRYRNTSSFKISKAQSMQIQKINKVNVLSARDHGMSKAPFDNFQGFHIDNTNNVLSLKFRQQFTKPSKDFQGNLHQSVEKNSSKSKTTDLGVQSWLNQALIQASPNLSIDKNQENSGLKIYSIDRSSLLRIGINPADVGRLYRSFFVYSLGFNTLLKEVCNQNKELRNAVWRVFAVLLEYCSGGNFQTTIGELQRDKQSKLSEMRLEIEKRQKIIEEKDEISEKKNGRILKEVRQLQEKSRQLQIERQVILQDFHEAEQAFNEQILLRLKYETKINQIHGAYEQLNYKNSLLLEQHRRMTMEMDKVKQTNDNLRQKLSLTSGQLQSAAIKIASLEEEKGVVYDTLSNLQNSSRVSSLNFISAKNASQSYIHLLNQKCRKIQQLELALKNIKASQKCLMLTAKSKELQFEQAMKENAELHQNNQRNLAIINDFMEQNRVLKQKSNQAGAQRQMERRKLDEKEKLVASAKLRLEQGNQRLRLNQILLQAQKQKNLALEKDLQSCYLNIKQMKLRQNQLSSALDESNKKVLLLEQTIQSKHSEIEKYIIQIEKLKQTVQEHKTELKQKQSKMLISEENMKAHKQVAQAKYAKLEQQYNLTKNKCSKYERQREELIGEIEQAKEKHQKIYTDFKNQKFERNNLNLYYQQSLSVMEEQIQHIKKLNIQISEMTEVIQQSQRKYSALGIIHKHKTQMLEKDAQFWKCKFQVLQKQLKQRKSFIHPLIFEDICESQLRLQEKFQIQNQLLKDKEKKLRQLALENLKITSSSESKHQKTNQDILINYKNEIKKKEDQIIFLKQKTRYLDKKYVESQENYSKAKKQKMTVQQSLRRVQSEMMEKVGLKSKELSNLNEKYRELLQVNQARFQDFERLQQRNESEKKRLEKKVQDLSRQLQLKQRTSRNICRNRQNKILVPSEVQQKEGKIKSDHSNMVEKAQESAEQKSGWNINLDENLGQEQLFNLDSRQKVEGVAPSNLQPQIGQLLKRREEMRKKIKGAYMYYRR